VLPSSVCCLLGNGSAALNAAAAAVMVDFQAVGLVLVLVMQLAFFECYSLVGCHNAYLVHVAVGDLLHAMECLVGHAGCAGCINLCFWWVLVAHSGALSCSVLFI